MSSSRVRRYAALRRRSGVARGIVPGSPWSPSPFLGVVGWALFFATIAVVVFGAVALAAPRTAGQLASSPRWDLLVRVATAIWLLPLAWWAWTIATTGVIRSRNLVELWWLRGSYGFALGYRIATWLAADHGRRLFFRAHGLAGAQVQWAELSAGVLGIVALQLTTKVLDGRRLYVRPTWPRRGGGFSLWLGTSTGKLAQQSHGAGIAGHRAVSLAFADAAQNIIVFGGIGQGKTTHAINPLLLQLLDQDCGGLIFDVKGDYGETVAALVRETSRDVDPDRDLVTIGPGAASMNLLAGLTPEVAASFLKSAFLLGGTPHDTIWVDSAVERCRNALGVLSFLADRYALSALHRYLFEPETRAAWDVEAKTQLDALRTAGDEREARRLASYLAYDAQIFAQLDPKLKSSVAFQVAQVLSPFTQPELVDAFCTAGVGPAMEAVLDGRVYLVRLPTAQYGMGAKVALTLIKLRLFNVLQRRRSEASWNQDRPVFFLCDEYQEIISAARDALSDLTFWDKSRSSGCLGIVSAQAVSSFYAALGGNEHLANTVLQNFRQRIVFRTEDPATIEGVAKLSGSVDVARVSESRGRSRSSRGFESTSTQSGGSSLSWHRQQVVDPQLFRGLKADQALALLSIGRESYDDVLEMPPVYIDERSRL
jgi:hypothetical protein